MRQASCQAARARLHGHKCLVCRRLEGEQAHFGSGEAGSYPRTFYMVLGEEFWATLCIREGRKGVEAAWCGSKVGRLRGGAAKRKHSAAQGEFSRHWW